MATQTLLLVAADKLAEAIRIYFETGKDAQVFQSKDIADCVLYHSAAAGAAAMASGVLPGAGALVAVAISSGAIWRMYIKICKIIGVDFGKNKLKAMSSAVLTNVVTQLTGLFAIQLASTFIPGAGMVVVGVGNFTVSYFSGLIFLNVLTRLFHAKRQDIEDMSNEEWVAAIKSTIDNIDKRAVMREAKVIFDEMRKDGSLNHAGQTTDISADDDFHP